MCSPKERQRMPLAMAAGNKNFMRHSIVDSLVGRRLLSISMEKVLFSNSSIKDPNSMVKDFKKDLQSTTIMHKKNSRRVDLKKGR